MSDLISREALLEKIGNAWEYANPMTIIDLITNAPAIEQGEPFGYFKAEPFGWTDCARTDEGAVALYEALPQKQWVGLSDDDIFALCPYIDYDLLKEAFYSGARAAEAKLKELNT